MVVSRSKFCCGDDQTMIHYCDFCGEPHDSPRAAEMCEMSHAGERIDEPSFTGP